MKLKDTLQNIILMLEASSLETKNLKEEIAELKTIIKMQHSCITVFSQKLEDMNEINVSNSTLIEELAHFSMDSSKTENNFVKQNLATSPTKLYLVSKSTTSAQTPRLAEQTNHH
jgi:hypothetical protein